MSKKGKIVSGGVYKERPLSFGIPSRNRGKIKLIFSILTKGEK